MFLTLSLALASPEICDGIDNDGEGGQDEAPVIVFADLDNDGYGDPSAPILRADCILPSMQAPVGNDCNDSSAVANPGETEVCDGIDNDCDGQIDETGCSGAIRYTLADSTYQMHTANSSWTSARNACQVIGYDLIVIEGATENSTLCNNAAADGEDWFWIGAEDMDDNGTYFWVDGSPVTYDHWDSGEPDNDDCAYVRTWDDDWRDWTCNSSSNTAGMCEVECIQKTWYNDTDGDGFGGSVHSNACSQPAGTVANNLDCNDGAAAVHPTATEVCNAGIDDDCDAATTEPAVDIYYLDADSDGFGNGSIATYTCGAPVGYVADNTDCDDTDSGIGGPVLRYPDVDADGYGQDLAGSVSCPTLGTVTTDGDCDDTNAHVNIGEPEVCDTVDNDCDGQIDEGTLSTFYLDHDADGRGTASTPIDTCFQPVGYVANTDDCNDSEPLAWTGAAEVCDGVDNDCNGQIDENGGLATYYADDDDDGYGDPATTQSTCGAPPGFVAVAGDCNDHEPLAWSGATEVCDAVDNNCNGATDEGVLNTYYRDSDLDGLGSTTPVLACAIEPGLIDNSEDCDDGDPGVGAATLWYFDNDNDNFGVPTPNQSACIEPPGYADNNTDCDDFDQTTFPGGIEVCDSNDNDCDGFTDELVENTYYADTDGDSQGDAGNTTLACTLPSQFVTNATDCDDTRNDVYLGAPEACDLVDNDCDSQVDEGAQTTYFRDSDNDGYGTTAETFDACSAPGGFVHNSDDCDDGEALAWTGNPEACDLVDNNCDGQVDEGVESTFWEDDDGDGYGNPTVSQSACLEPAGFIDNDLDCDDTRASAFPGAPEACNSLDDDCDNQVDENQVDVQWYNDNDNDGYGGATGPFQCDPPVGMVSTPGDCNDAVDTISPAAIEVCDFVDNDCDGTTDVGASDATLYFLDLDGDGYGDPVSGEMLCELPANGTLNSTDCDDTDHQVSPDATELCDGFDNNCDGITDLDAQNAQWWYPDNDADGQGDQFVDGVRQCIGPLDNVNNHEDCDDSDPDRFVGAQEICDGQDTNCNGLIDDDVVYRHWFIDGDGDSWGGATGPEVTCAPPPGQVGRDGDCQDGIASINPAANELCDGVDNDCDGTADVGALDAVLFYVDADDDGYGDGTLPPFLSCEPNPTNAATNADDCQDGSDQVFPGNPEVCDGIDNDCSNGIDDGLAVSTWYRDQDGDGFGGDQSVDDCFPPGDDWYANTGDCADGDATIYPGAMEIPGNGIDEDCDGEDLPADPPTPTDPPTLPDTGDTGSVEIGSYVDSGCGCSQTTGAPWAVFLLVPWLVRRR